MDTRMLGGSLMIELDQPPHTLHQDIAWDDLYEQLRPLVSSLVYRRHLPSWKGQEEDLTDDILQETIVRLFRQLQKVEAGEATPIKSLFHLSQRIACNYVNDLYRRDRRLTLADQVQWNYIVIIYGYTWS